MDEQEGSGLMTGVASMIIAMCAGYAAWQMTDLLEKRKESRLVQTREMTPEQIEKYKRVLFYGGLAFAVILFLATNNVKHAFSVFSLCFFGGIFLEKGIGWKEKNQVKQMVSELSVYLDTFLTLHKSGMNMEDALRDSLVVTKHLPALMEPVLERWHDRGGAEQAIKSLEETNVQEIKTLSTMLLQVVKGGEKSLDFIEQWKDQLALMEHLNRQANSNKKPVFYTVLLGLPFLASVITWFYPYFIQARDMFSGFLGM
jgi:hypothetical protein